MDLLDHETPQLTRTQTRKVSKLIQNWNWVLSIPALTLIWTSISCIRISVPEDSWKSIATSTGLLSIASAWNKIRESSAEFELQNMIWFPSSSPKMACCLIKRVLDRLPTRAWLVSCGIINTDSCVLCNMGLKPETICILHAHSQPTYALSAS